MKAKKRMSIPLSLVLVSTLFAGCTGNSASPASSSNSPKPSADAKPATSAPSAAAADNGLIPDVKGELSTLVVLGQLNGTDPDLGGVYDYFKKYYPDLKLKQQDIAHEEYAPETLTKAIAAGNTPDVYVTVPGDIPDLISKKYIEPLDSLLKAEPNYVKTLNTAAMDVNKIGGKTYGVTWMTLPQTWMINTDLFEKMGVPVPTDDWTIDDFIAINKKMVDKANGITGSNPNVKDPWVLYSFLEAYGVKGVKTVDNKPVSSFAEDPNAIKALEKWIEYTSKSSIAFTDQEMTKFGLNDPWSAYWYKGHAGMVPWSLWGQPYNADTKKNAFNWTVVRQPKGPGGRAAIAYGITMAIFPTSQKKELAMKYIQIVTSKHFYENARIKDPKTGKLSPLTLSPNEPVFPIGIPAINVKFQTTKDNQAALDGFVRAMQDGKIADYGGFGQTALNEMTAKLPDVAAGKVQIPDMLKELDQVLNTKYYNAK
ncbi:ABC transporter substrate-binding protein [Paenibacillus sp. MBLB4367]|uniref:ABC transporter substrate-binding protein n=1 Tax=Paenibacillus sp. MBLB4367 TaxID=3384767 RepID=UPI003907F9F2